MRNFLFTFLFLPLFGMTVYAQSKADKYVEEATKLVESKQYSLANTKLQAAANAYKNEGNLSLYIKCVAEQGKNLSDNSQDVDAIRVLEALIRDAENFMKQPDENLALAHKYLGAVYYNNDDLLKAMPYFVKALELREKANPSSEDLFRDNYNLGVMYRNLGNNAASIKYLNKAIELQLKKPNAVLLSKMYLQLGISYKLLGSFSEAEDYLDIAIKFIEEIEGPMTVTLAPYYVEKGAIQRESAISFESMKKALATLIKAEALFEKSKTDDFYNYATCLTNIGIIYLVGIESFNNKNIEKESVIKALGYFEKALKLNTQYQPNSTTLVLSYINIAMSKAKLNDFATAKKDATKAIELAKKIIPEKHVVFSELYGVEAEIFELENDLENTLVAYTKAMSSLIEDYTSTTDVSLLPDYKFLEQGKVLSLNKLKDFVALKGRAYFKKYKESKAIKDLELALTHLQYVDKIADKIRSDYTSEGGKMILSDMIVDAYENAIAICLELAKAKKDPSFKEKAYYYSEKSKGLLLLEAFQSSKAGKMVGLSDAAVKEEENLRLTVSDLKQQIYQYKTRGEAQTDAAKQLEKELFTAKQAYATYVKRMERENPDYYNMKFNIKLLDVAQTRKLLKKDQALLEYFVGDKQIFVFKITATEFEVYTLANNKNLARTVKNFRESIYGYYLDAVERTDDAYEKYSNDYAKYGSELYETLVKPLGNLPKRLVIVPAGPLANMPFEPLLKQKPADGKLYKTHKYMGKEHIISYNYSATLLSEMINKKHSANRETFLAFAPTFGGDAADGVTMRNRRFALAPLNYNTTEVQNVRKILGTGTVFIGKDAVEERFKSIGSNFQIVHFATHGMANDRDPDFSLLAFTEVPDSIENEFIYVSDLYNMQLNADLVVLSACETGLGELRKGEGVISLARGFSYAGAKGIFTTLWSVNDLATSLIIESFYKYLKQGKDKDEALYLAKMDFLSQADNQKAHPFLWAPFIFIGDTSPLEIKGSGMPWMFIGIAAAVVALLGLAFMMLKRKKESA